MPTDSNNPHGVAIGQVWTDNDTTLSAEEYVRLYDEIERDTEEHFARADSETLQAIRAQVQGLTRLVRSICPEATSLQWELCGLTKIPTTLGPPSVICFHEDGIVGLKDFQLNHTPIAGLPLLNDIAVMFSRRLMSKFHHPFGIVETQDPDGDPVFTLDLTHADTHPTQEAEARP